MSKLDKIDIDELINRVDTVYGTQGQSVSEPGAVSPAIQPTEQTPQVSLLESILRGGVQGATLDYADEMTGGMQALGDIALSDSTMQDLPELYRKYRDESRANYDAAQEANPVAYGASQVGGGVLSTVVPVGLASKGALATAKGAAALGGLAGLGASDADLTKGDVVGATGDVALGAGLGVAGQKIGSAIASSETGKAIGKKLTDTLTSKATKFEEAGSAQIAKLLGGGKGDVKKILQTKGASTDFGKTVLKEDALPLTGDAFALEDAAEKAIVKKESIANRYIDDIKNQLDALDPDNKEIANNDFLTSLKTLIEKRETDTFKLTGDAKKAAQARMELEDSAIQLVDAADDPRKLIEMRRLYGETIKDASRNPTAQPSVKQENLKELEVLANERLQQLGNLVGGTTGDKFRKAQFDISNLIKAKNMAISKQAEGSKLFKPTLSDTLLGGALGTATGSPLVGLTAIAAKKAAEAGLGDTLGNIAQRGTVRGKFKVAERFRELASDPGNEVLKRGAISATATAGSDQIQSDVNTKIEPSVYADKAARIDDSDPRDAELKKLLIEAAQDRQKAATLQFRLKSTPDLLQRYNAL